MWGETEERLNRPNKSSSCGFRSASAIFTNPQSIDLKFQWLNLLASMINWRFWCVTNSDLTCCEIIYFERANIVFNCRKCHQIIRSFSIPEILIEILRYQILISRQTNNRRSLQILMYSYFRLWSHPQAPNVFHVWMVQNCVSASQHRTTSA